MKLVVLTLVLYLTGVYAANILGVFVFPSLSHQIVYQPIWRELSLRGHQVTVITPNPLKDPTLPNLTEIDVSFSYEFLKVFKLHQILKIGINSLWILEKIAQLSRALVEAQLNCPEVKALIANQSKHFDLVLVEFFHPVMYAFSARFNAPIIGVSSMQVLTLTDDLIGNPTHPVLYPDMILNFNRNYIKLWQKAVSVVLTMLLRYYHRYRIIPNAHKQAIEYFGNHLAYLGDLERSQSMFFINNNPSMHTPKSTAPIVIEMGQMHIKPIQRLPADLKVVLDKAKHGFVYVSLGTNIHISDLKKTLKSTIMEALAELPYIVIMKTDCDDLPEKSPNIITKHWLPQQDLLAHPNIKAFVTQGGLQSIDEAVSRKVPMVGIPFMIDQPSNVQNFVDLGIGLQVNYLNVTKQQLKSYITEVAQNSKFKKRIQELGYIVNDKPMTGIEAAVWWAEYVIRHKGAKHLKNSLADMSWFEFLFLDVILVTSLLSVLVVWLCYKLVLMIKSIKMLIRHFMNLIRSTQCTNNT